MPRGPSARRPLTVTRLRLGEKKSVRLSQATTGPVGNELWGQAASEHLLPVMYLYNVRLPALHQLTLRVEASQPVVLAASEDRLGALVSSSPRALVEVRRHGAHTLFGSRLPLLWCEPPVCARTARRATPITRRSSCCARARSTTPCTLG